MLFVQFHCCEETDQTGYARKRSRKSPNIEPMSAPPPGVYFIGISRKPLFCHCKSGWDLDHLSFLVKVSLF